MFKVWTDGSTLNGKDVVRRVETEEDGGYDYSAIPEQPIPTGRQTPILVRDPVSGVLEWVETDRSPNENERIQDLENSLAQKDTELTAVKAENTSIREQLAQTNADAVGFQDFIFEKFPELA